MPTRLGHQARLSWFPLSGSADEVLFATGRSSAQGEQGSLYTHVEESFCLAQQEQFRDVASQCAQSVEKAHGRLEIRKHWLLRWSTKRAVPCAVLVATFTALPLRFAVIGAVKIACSGCSTAPFACDESRMHSSHADHHFAILRQLALHLLRQEKAAHHGSKAKRLNVGWSQQCLVQVLSGFHERYLPYASKA